jgi:hypothetical protein
MTRKTPICYILLWLALFCKPLFAATTLHHELQISLDPDHEQLRATDTITLVTPQDPEPPKAGNRKRQRFLLHQGLSPRSLTAGVTLDEIGAVGGSRHLIEYQVSMPEDQRNFTLEYGGKIAHPLTRLKESPGRVSERLAGTISQQGVYLDAATGWYPYFPDRLYSFDLQVELPQTWLAVSQGEGPEINREAERGLVRWRETSPQDDIYLIAAPYHLYRQSSDSIEAQVFLRQADPALAEGYLQATDHYLKLYQSLIGPYPYAKFALVENFWESGYGMPSFTLLGPQVLRLPFIIHTSYPHEILHNWWGNSVYVDYQAGNWSEGLTSYLADHLLAEQRGRGSNHRRTALKRFGDFVRSENDFPLTEFRARHTTASQAVGYDKSLMLFHMLRRHLGDQAFIEGLRLFYRENRFKTASYADLQRAFEKAGGHSLAAFFRQWTERSGAPGLAIGDLAVEQGMQGYRIRGTLLQRQSSAPFTLEVPLRTQLTDGQVIQTTLVSSDRVTPFEIELPGEPRHFDIDPWFDLFRLLDPAETPATLSRLFGSDRALIVLPSKANASLLQAYQALARQWRDGYEDAEIRLDSDLQQLPRDRSVWLLGRENLFYKELLTQLSDLPVSLQEEKLTVADAGYEFKDHSFVLCQRDPANGRTMAWVVGGSDTAVTRLAQKLPHYGKYSYLVFRGDQAQIDLKGEWPVTRSPLGFDFSKDGTAVEMGEPGPLFSLPRR